MRRRPAGPAGASAEASAAAVLQARGSAGSRAAARLLARRRALLGIVSFVPNATASEQDERQGGCQEEHHHGRGSDLHRRGASKCRAATRDQSCAVRWRKYTVRVDTAGTSLDSGATRAPLRERKTDCRPPGLGAPEFGYAGEPEVAPSGFVRSYPGLWVVEE